MRENSSQFFVGIDIGTSQVRCVVGSLDSTSDEPKISIIGYGSSENTGMKKGITAHIEEVASAVHNSIVEAERVSGVKIENATVNINGSHIGGINSKGVVAISASSKQISYADKYRAEEAATIVQLPSNREIIQVFPKNYQVDGQDSIKDPVGMQGVRLEVETHIITATTPYLKSLDQVLKSVGVYPSNYTVSGLAAAEIVLSRKQREAGCLVIDIGASTTNMAVIEDGEVQHVAVIPMGGINITNDLAIGLKIDLEIAEKMKLKHAALADAAKTGKVSVEKNKMNYVFEADDVNMIVEARAEEIFEYIDKELEIIQRSQKLPGGVVLVGGTAKIPGLADFAKDKLGLSAKIGSLKNINGIMDNAKDLRAISSVGLMYLDMIFGQDPDSHNLNKNNLNIHGGASIIRSIWSKIKP
jgi:cell division protein FtsA